MFEMLAIAALGAAVASDSPRATNSELALEIRRSLPPDAMPVAMWPSGFILGVKMDTRDVDLDFYEYHLGKRGGAYDEDWIGSADKEDGIYGWQRGGKRANYRELIFLLMLIPGPYNGGVYRNLGLPIPPGASISQIPWETLESASERDAKDLLESSGISLGPGEGWNSQGLRQPTERPGGGYNRRNWGGGYKVTQAEHPFEYLQRIGFLGDPRPGLRKLTRGIERPSWVNPDLIPTALQRASGKSPLTGDLSFLRAWVGLGDPFD